ncbi:MAG TPA: N-acetylmuramoyl-L-alanine amidase [bacterium]|nr:N-acetylmuramoyl-L-alanine amidase [bacterium]HEX68362.1 N-acetylmuramoyl-L-alanine amidase [bacterium]
MRKNIGIFLLLALSLPLFSLEVKGVRYSCSSSKARVVLTLDSYPYYRVEKEEKTLKVYLPGYEGEDKKITFPNSLVSSIRLVSQPVSFLVEVNTTRPFQYQIFRLGSPERLVIDIFFRNLSSINIRKVVIDPGHGGKDPGAIGWGGIKEKDIVLKVALYLRNFLAQEGLEVYLTRRSDVFVPLKKRVEFANKIGADLFISIHCNSSLSRRACGFETYYLSEALDDHARAVARVENSVVKLENPVEKWKLTILEDLSLLEFRKESILLAQLLQEKLDACLPTPNRGVKSALFYVLKGVHAPAVLVEIGFISNPWEARMLRKSYFQREIARCISEGIVKFTWKIALRENETL